MICPGIAISSCVPDLGLWREYQNLLLKQMFFEVLPKLKLYCSKLNEEKLVLGNKGFWSILC